MIASVAGVVTRVGLDHVVVRTGNGLGMLVHVTPSTAAGVRHGSEVELATSLVVREDSLTLFGFADDDERVLFETVQTVSGVGPRLALAMLAVLAPAALSTAIASGDLGTLTKVPGIGRKGAERIVLELRDKVGGLALAGGGSGVDGPEGNGATAAAAGGAAWREQVTAALVGLGWSAKQAEGALDTVAEQLGETPEVSAALRAALRELGR